MSSTFSTSRLLSAQQWSAIQQSLQIDAALLPWTHLNQAWLLDSAFSDSTHSLVKLDTDAGTYYLKWLRKNLTQQAFWQDVKAWLGYDLAQGYQYQPDWAFLLQQVSPLQIAQILLAVSPSDSQQHGYVLSRAIAGHNQPPKTLSDPALKILAQQVSQLHRLAVNETAVAENWMQKTHAFVQTLDLQPGLVAHAVDKTLACPIKALMPVMLDFRWDQLQWQEDMPIGMVDMDAWVMAPASLHLVMLELLLNAEQSTIWRDYYVAYLAGQGIDSEALFSQLEAWRDVFRLILFRLNWLGADNLHTWLSAPKNFEVV
ncbi:hypothetical protein [Thiomicrospira microaerophila]|uniref:hypothetical protein n=1 Tax=Thiomicrospira microaerophila TaxID=406020 RepID=UPI0012FDB808|nr:hypothetical protein [Thiomicrospira microaerophila]